MITTREKSERMPCEVYSRVCGYLRPVKQWNDGKQAEFFDRKEFNIKNEIYGEQSKQSA